MKKDKKYYGDTRLNHFCAFCGCPTETVDHVPSKCFLDKPHPQDLPVIPCFCKCNHDFSLDEEYVSCMIDCMKAGTARSVQSWFGTCNVVLGRWTFGLLHKSLDSHSRRPL